jgi:hypothetical protein
MDGFMCYLEEWRLVQLGIHIFIERHGVYNNQTEELLKNDN